MDELAGSQQIENCLSLRPVNAGAGPSLHWPCVGRCDARMDHAFRSVRYFEARTGRRRNTRVARCVYLWVAVGGSVCAGGGMCQGPGPWGVENQSPWHLGGVQ